LNFVLKKISLRVYSIISNSYGRFFWRLWGYKLHVKYSLQREKELPTKYIFKYVLKHQFYMSNYILYIAHICFSTFISSCSFFFSIGPWWYYLYMILESSFSYKNKMKLHLVDLSFQYLHICCFYLEKGPGLLPLRDLA
jgi:hypothetical protein